MANEDVAWGYELENYINIGTPEAPKWVKATELLSWEQSGESKTYEPAWIDRKTPPTLTYGRSCSINMEKDTVRDGELDEWIFKHRNDLDVPCEIAKVYTWKLDEAGKALADKAAFKFTANPHSNSNQGQPVTSAGTFNMSDEAWSEGTWDASAKAFAPQGRRRPSPRRARRDSKAFRRARASPFTAPSYAYDDDQDRRRVRHGFHFLQSTRWTSRSRASRTR